MTVVRQYLWSSMVVIAAWIAAVLLVNPSGDFPLNDDFSFGKSVYHLCVEGRLLLDDWLSMPLLTHLLWGAAWCEVFGFSFEVLRWANIVAGAAGLLVFFRVLSRWLPPAYSLPATLLLGFNPWYFSLACTFMTDVHFVGWMVVAFWCWYRWYDTGRSGWLLLALGCSVAATLIRQTGLMLFTGYGAYLLLQPGRSVSTYFKAVGPILGGAALLWGYTEWLQQHQGLPETYGRAARLFSNALTLRYWGQVPQRLTILLTYGGLFLLPFLLIFRAGFSEGRNTTRRMLLTAAFLAGVALSWEKFPWGNIFYNLGLGPKLLKDGQFNINVFPILQGAALVALRVLAFGSGALFIWSFPAKLSRTPHAVFTSVCLLLYTGFLLFDTHSFDRYFLPLLPLLMLLFAFGKPKPAPGRLRRLTAWSVAGCIAAFSVMATHDYLNWNRTTWQALDWLTRQRNLPPNRIDGGFTFNGLHRPGALEHGRARSWWWVDKDDYCVTFGSLPGFTTDTIFIWQRWLPPGTDSLYVLRRPDTGHPTQ